MEKLSILDVVALAKAGYKPSEVKEIMAMANVPDVVQENAPKESAEPEAPKDPTEKETPVASDTPDYKAMFEEQQKKLEELSSKLDAAQKANIATDVSSSQSRLSTSETINNIFKDVIS